MEGARTIATQDFGWSQVARRAGLAWPDATAWAMRQAAEAGFGGWEPLLRTPGDAARVGALARAHGLAMPSAFMAGALHDDAAAPATVARIAATAEAALAEGCARAVVYPEALPEGDKTDAQLTAQASHLQALAATLRPLGVSLLYHLEEPDMRHGAREFHHMLLGTDPALVRVCLDPDAVWRGAGRSNVALMDVARLYGDRVDALHLRQSRGGVWDEVVGPGDIDLPALAALLAPRAPLLVVEHAYEAGTPATMDPVDAHRQSLAFVRATFAP